ncbi:hypothetical protein IWZ03DRAFT_389094 [Phyllosticta citriasiana]|uniref:Uncharacterized protein n=2 Tax=Phyllosticta citriasiana TaxID=595635 RepID=A0ABR1K8Z5_9PEZI
MIGMMLAAQVAVTPTSTNRILAVTPKSRTTTSKSSKITTGSEDCIEQFVCIDYINTCGMRYGGCHDICKPTSYTDPGCPKTKRPCFRPGACI